MKKESFFYKIKLISSCIVLALFSTGCTTGILKTALNSEPDETISISYSEDGVNALPADDNASFWAWDSVSDDSSSDGYSEYGESSEESSEESVGSDSSEESAVSDTVSDATPPSEADVPSAAESGAEPVSQVTEISEKEPAKEPEPVKTPEPVKEPEPEVQVTVPQIALPSAPGTLTASSGKGTVDYSNAADGYISAVYTGAKKKVKLRIQCNGTTYDHNVSVDGRTDFFPLSCGDGSYTVTMYEQIEGKKYTEAVGAVTFDVSMNSSLSPFLYPNKYVNFTGSSDCVYKAAQLCAGKTADIDKIAAVFEWVSDNISYDYDLASTVSSGYVPYPDNTLMRGRGICFDYSSLVAAMLRSQSIPTRLVIGYASPEIYHAWNEVYTEETGWITPELMLKNMGYNLLDSTFYSTAGDKSVIADYISNSGNYSASYYY